MKKKIASHLFFITGLLMLWPVHASDLTRIHTLLKQNKARQAYHILVKEEDHHLGEIEYDLLLGRTALTAGFHHESIFAYERVLLNQPGNDNARYGLAVAHYTIGENDRAEQLFREILLHNPEEKVVVTVRQYLENIDTRRASLKHKLTGSLGIRAGWDSNINSATSNTTFELFGNLFPLSDESRETDALFTELLGRFEYKYTMHNNAQVFGKIELNKRENHDENYDTDIGNLQAGANFKTAYGRLSLPLTLQTVVLDNKTLRAYSAIAASLSGTDTKESVSTNLQYGQIRYPHQSALDVDLISFGVGYATTNKAATIHRLIGIQYGNETAVSAQYAYNARITLGIQGKLYYALSRVHILHTRLMYQLATYREKHPFFSQLREDTLLSLSFGWNWQVNKNWSLEARAETSSSDSTVNLYDFRRNLIQMGINYHL